MNYYYITMFFFFFWLVGRRKLSETLIRRMRRQVKNSFNGLKRLGTMAAEHLLLVLSVMVQKVGL